MAYVLRTPFILATSLCVLVPDVAFARREPGPADVPAAAPQPVAPAAAPDGTAPAATTPAATPAAAPIAGPITAPIETPVDATPVASAPAPAPVVPPSVTLRDTRAPVHVPDGKNAGVLLAAGIGLGGGFYLFTSMAGAIAVDRGKKGHRDPMTGVKTRDKERVAFGRSLMIPLVGPFLAIGHTDSAMKRWGASMSGIAQVGAAVLIVAGIVAKSRSNRARRLGWTAGATNGGGALMIHGRF